MKYILFFHSLLLFLVSCEPVFNKTSSPSENVLFVSTTDSIGSASFSTINLNTLKVYKDIGLGMIHTDSSIRYFNKKIYVLNRLGRDNLQVLDPYADFSTIMEFSLKTEKDNYPNPQDITLISPEKAYISLYNEKKLMVINPSLWKKINSIDISKYGYSGCVPCMGNLYYETEKGIVFLALQRLDTNDWTSKSYGSILCIDPTKDSVEKEIKLVSSGTEMKNPYSRFRYLYGKNYDGSTEDYLFISCVGKFKVKHPKDDWDGGIVKLKIYAKDNIVVEGFILEEKNVAGDVCDFTILSKNQGYAVIMGESGKTSLIRFNPETGEKVSTLKENNKNDGYLWRIEAHRSGRLFLCDKSVVNPGIRVFNLADDSQLNDGKPLFVGLPPDDLAFVE